MKAKKIYEYLDIPDLPTGTLLICKHPGKVFVIEGNPKSINAYPGDRFIITDNQDDLLYFGDLEINGEFNNNSLYGIQKDMINTKDDYFATFKVEKISAI